MRTKRQLLFDRLYYGFELDIHRFFFNLQGRRAMRGVKFDRAFYRAYREEVVPYWRRFGIKPKLHWVKQCYLRQGVVDPRNIPVDVFYRYIDPYFNNRIYTRPMNDKNLHHLFFPEVKRPETVFKYIDGLCCEDDLTPISPEEARARLARAGQYIIKPARDTGAGADIAFFDGPLSPADADSLLGKYKSVDFIVQRVVAQHPDMAHFNASSLNTLRVITLVFHGKAHLLSAIIRIGHPGSRVDNVSLGGYQVSILPDGTLDKLAYTHQGGKERFVEQNEAGQRFEGFAIPSWDKVRATALDLALRLPHLKLIGWDFSVDENGDVILIELNTEAGQNQETCGPTFMDMTDEVLTEVFADKKKRLRL